jgi:hypothetical protein
MAIAFRSVGARLKTDVGASGGTPTVALPSGHASGDCLILVVQHNSKTAESVTSAGWTLLGRANAAAQTNSRRYPTTSVYWRVDNGSLGSTVGLSFSTASYPTGDPEVIACILAYSGTHTTNPIGQWGMASTTATAASQAHPQLTTTDANDWLLTVRGVGDSFPETFTASGGTNSERVDDTDGFDANSIGIYDSNGALSAGLQTQRVTAADGGPDYGSTMFSVAIRPPAASTSVNAFPGFAHATGTAYGATATVHTVKTWQACTVGVPDYSCKIDWNNDGDFNDANEIVTPDVMTGGFSVEYGRDNSRQLNPPVIGSMSFSVINADRKYSPEWTASILNGDLDPARPVQFRVTFNGETFSLFNGKIDDFDVTADQDNRSVSFTFLDFQSDLQSQKLSTPLYEAIRSGAAVHAVLDAVGWSGPRDVDYGASFFPYWWVEGDDAFTALQNIVQSEGPPSIAYQAPDGTFVFRDRHHRIQRDESVTSQATFAQAALGDCAVSPAATGYGFTKPFTYAHGLRDIINSVSFDVAQRAPDAEPTAVWTSSDVVSLGIGETTTIEISTSDPFKDAISPVSTTDYMQTGTGVAVVQMSRVSGASATLIITASGGPVSLSNLQLRATSVPVLRTVKISNQDASSIAAHGEKTYPNPAPYANVNDAAAIAQLIVSSYANRRPTVAMRVVSTDPDHWHQVVARTLSDRITIINGEMGLDSDFYVEHVAHTIERIWDDRPPVHAVVLTCEKVIQASPLLPFTFNAKGLGFDQGVFDPTSSDNSDTVFIWDDPVQGAFDVGQYGT